MAAKAKKTGGIIAATRTDPGGRGRQVLRAAAVVGRFIDFVGEVEDDLPADLADQLRHAAGSAACMLVALSQRYGAEVPDPA